MLKTAILINFFKYKYLIDLIMIQFQLLTSALANFNGISNLKQLKSMKSSGYQDMRKFNNLIKIQRLMLQLQPINTKEHQLKNCSRTKERIYLIMPCYAIFQISIMKITSYLEPERKGKFQFIYNLQQFKYIYLYKQPFISAIIAISTYLTFNFLTYQLFIIYNSLKFNMNQRSSSVTRKFKTDFNQQQPFDKKITKIIKEKKQSINKMITPRVRGYKPSNYNTRPTDKTPTSSTNIDYKSQIPKIKTIDIDDYFIQQFEDKYNNKDYYCTNHPHKVGSFESIHDRTTYYCYQCAINLVKMNNKIYKITTQSQIVKLYLEEQFQKITQTQQKIHHKISQYYLSLKEHLLDCYVEAHNAINSNRIITFGSFQYNQQNVRKIEELLGNMEECRLRFITQENKKENMSHKHINIVITQQEINQKVSKQKQRQKQRQRERQRFANIRNPNHSLQIYNEKNSSVIKDRQYSYYLKGQKSQNRKPRNQYKKSIYMR